MNRAESITSKLFMLTISLVFTLILIETAANFYLWNVATEEQFNVYASINQIQERYGRDFLLNASGDDLLYVPHHSLGYVLNPEFDDGKNRHNSLGYRGDEFDLEKSEGTYRIVALGASTTYGTEVRDYQKSYPYNLEIDLHEAGYTQVEVINAGVGGYTTHETLLNLHFRIMQLDPDLIIIYHGINDVHTRFVYPSEAYKPDNSGYRATGAQDTVIPTLPEYSTAIRIFGIAQGIYSSQSSIEWTVSRPAKTGYFDDFLRQSSTDELVDGLTALELLQQNTPIYFEDNLRAMVALADINDVAVVLMTPATQIESDSYISSEPYLFALDEHREVIRTVANDTSAYLYDFSEVFPIDDDLYFKDGRHMSRQGNELRAQMITDFLIENEIIEQTTITENRNP